ncbi:MAG: hypothetical protein L3J92_01255 [Thermoplasmata archaeon]|jgi:hypothetical protein|nr:hypothetical protein [Thermoplasmata archaeon]
MAGRVPAGAGSSSSALRLEILKELQSILEDREVRDRLDRGPLSETKGREHWILHLLLRAQESTTQHFDVLIQTAYSNLTARIQSVEDRQQRGDAVRDALGAELKTRLQELENGVADRVGKEIGTGVGTAAQKISQDLIANLDNKWKPIGESVESFAQRSSQLTKDLSDTFRVATQNRLLLNENARRIIDLGRDILALEESLKLSLSKVLEEGLAPLEQRVAALEGRVNGADASDTPARDTASNGT